MNPLVGTAWITIFGLVNGPTAKILNDKKMQNNVFIFFAYATETFAFSVEFVTRLGRDCRLAYAASINEENIGCGLRGFD